MTEFPKVGFFSKGYHRGQVDAFFEDARRAYEGGLPPEQFSAEQVRLATRTARRPCIRASSAPAVSVSPTRAAGGATTARPWMICLIVSPPTSTRPGS